MQLVFNNMFTGARIENAHRYLWLDATLRIIVLQRWIDQRKVLRVNGLGSEPETTLLRTRPGNHTRGRVPTHRIRTFKARPAALIQIALFSD
jgi:hypothetical protein